jgi:hypothetical protein
MISRVGLVVLLAIAATLASGSALGVRQPPRRTPMYLVQHDLRLCPSPRCGGYWLAIANGARTRCFDLVRRARCYVARAVDGGRRTLTDVPEGALVRGAMESGRDGLGVLIASAAYAPAGTADVSGGLYRVVDNGIRCIRAPCFSYRATPVNGSVRIAASSIDLAASGATGAEVARAQRALFSKNGLYARGRLARTPDGGTVFRALRIYLRAPLPRA